MQALSLTPTVIGLLIGFFIELIIGIYILFKDPGFPPNRFLSLSYLSLAFTILINTLYLLINVEINVIYLMHRLSNFFAIIFGIFLLTTIFYVFNGSLTWRNTYYITIVGYSLISGLLTFFYNGVIITKIGDSVFIEWDFVYYFLNTFPIILLGFSVVYQFIRLLGELEENDPKNQVYLSILAYFLITLAYLVSRTPYYLASLISDVPDYIDLLALIGSILVLIVSLLIAWIYLRANKSNN